MTDDDYKILTLSHPTSVGDLQLAKYNVWLIYWQLDDNGYFTRNEDTDHRFRCFCRGLLPSQTLSYIAVRDNPDLVEDFLNEGPA